MLEARHRLVDPEGFRAASRRGRRAGGRCLVTHLLLPGSEQVVGVPGHRTSGRGAGGSARVGFVVSKAVGTAVVRNRVKRRLRHAMRERVAGLPVGATLVVRAQPAAAGASYRELVAELDRCLQRVAQPATERREAG
ncbi:ribonuclease P protein component [Nocardioides sp. zg-536]|uniref:Ribonuclease P protein component n=1 Tax=Nocardioides faecalis TaxID=2803858 RepID=A0A938Y9I6_9ACTN|nr:ribonuclease P protein component [Nocardioides faecalis]MBM9459936.1 ribonuclease P protein component [Nocardioides faecalis]MBS4753194.1 ribonuclease P protein component [Nocardioides faecalis]QVI60770.1 ribonuclease P protein component [Nocardioides faecalis]